MKTIEARAQPGSEVFDLLLRHPGVSAVGEGEGRRIEFSSGGCQRFVESGDHMAPCRGLIELMDNNPIVCSDLTSTPSAAGTLSLIALGPVIRAGLLIEDPSILTSFDADSQDVAEWLRTEGWQGDAVHAVERLRIGNCRAITAIAVVRSLKDVAELEELYDEPYGRSLYVRRQNGGDLDPRSVAGRQHALYTLSIAEERPNCLLTVRVIADAEGKCGAGQMIHMMNLMAGFEESSGIGA